MRLRNIRKPSTILRVVLVAALLTTIGLQHVTAGALKVRWDIISVDLPPTTVNAGGVAYADAPNYASPSTPFRLKLTGSGTFVAPSSGHSTGAVTGGGTWEIFLGNTSTGQGGTYWVTEFVSFQFANFQLPGLIDLIGDTTQRANGNALLKIQYDDGSEGTLGIGCHGPGAPNGIVEGVIATKDYFTFWFSESPTPTLNANRTIFHVE
jgi:hypothetical protein